MRVASVSCLSPITTHGRAGILQGSDLIYKPIWRGLPARLGTRPSRYAGTILANNLAVEAGAQLKGFR